MRPWTLRDRFKREAKRVHRLLPVITRGLLASDYVAGNCQRLHGIASAQFDAFDFNVILRRAAALFEAFLEECERFVVLPQLPERHAKLCLQARSFLSEFHGSPESCNRLL